MSVELPADDVRTMTAEQRVHYAAQVRERLVRFQEVPPNWDAFSEARLPGNERGSTSTSAPA